MTEIKDHMDRGVQCTVRPDGQVLVVSGPGGVLAVSKSGVAALRNVCDEALANMVEPEQKG